MIQRKELDVVQPVVFKYFWADFPSHAHDIWDNCMQTYMSKLVNLTSLIQQHVPKAVPVMVAQYLVALALPDNMVVPSFLRPTRRGKITGYIPAGQSHKAKGLKKLIDTVTITPPQQQFVKDLGLRHETGYSATIYETTAFVKHDRIWVRVPLGGNTMSQPTPIVPDYFVESDENECNHWLRYGRSVPQQLNLF